MVFLKSHHGEGDYEPHTGIKAEPISADGKNIKIVYNGLLAKSGADQVLMRAGFGTRNSWNDVYDHHMSRTVRGWESPDLHMNDRQLNFCFKDSAGNWDNNNGENWSYLID
ncbi:MAG: hypothetical protein CVU89_00690 [Firmicutes bacterium HGW-Firmicutes-14]|nr:MAG: hypothetical protein CVU89_00690 [Firmicutes bacterium HGW-Firmicutes-14]